MNLEAIAIQSKPGEHESLALAVRALARSLAAEMDYDELCAALGISLVAVAGPEDSSPGLWLTYARDAFLAPTCRLFGLQVRDLHPPDVGMDMLWAEEFPQHFQLSYKPLIRRALEHEQPVLAWRGWEGEAGALWGVITAVHGEELWGVVPGAAGRARLTEPAMQCYVVEQYERRTPSSEEVLAAALAHAHAYLSQPQELVKRPDPQRSRIVTGPQAYEAWARWLEAQPPCDGQDPAREVFRTYAGRLCAARLSAMRFLHRADTVAGPDHANILDSIVAACDELVEELSPFSKAEEISAFWSTAEGHIELLEAVRAAKRADEQIVGYIGKLLATG
jgi:hypothetical protein